MKKFHFRFESVLEMRKKREEEALRVFALAQGAFQTEIDRKNSLEKDLENSLKRREELGSEPVMISAFQAEDHFIVGTKQRIIQVQQAIFRAKKSVDKALRSYLFAKKQLRIMERIYEQDYAKYRDQGRKKSEKELDDFTIMRFHLSEESA